MNTKDKNKLMEEDLGKPVSDYFVSEGYTVRSEVNFCDITAVKGETLVIIELKKNLSVELLSQAVKRQKIADMVYIAVPKPKRMVGSSRWRDICHLIRRLELGLILVSFRGKSAFIEIPIYPVEFDRQKSIQMNRRKRDSLIKEIGGRNGDLNTGGSKGKKLVTAYRESAVFIACCLEKHGPLSPKRLRELGTDNRKTTSILSENHYGWFSRTGRGVYELNEKGREALKEYEALTNHYYEKLD